MPFVPKEIAGYALEIQCIDFLNLQYFKFVDFFYVD